MRAERHNRHVVSGQVAGWSTCFDVSCSRFVLLAGCGPGLEISSSFAPSVWRRKRRGRVAAVIVRCRVRERLFHPSNAAGRKTGHPNPNPRGCLQSRLPGWKDLLADGSRLQSRQLSLFSGRRKRASTVARPRLGYFGSSFHPLLGSVLGAFVLPLLLRVATWVVCLPSSWFFF